MVVARSVGRGQVLYRLLWGVLFAIAPAIATADYAFNLQHPVTTTARRILELHNLIFVICVVIFIVVFAFMFYSMIVHRKSKGFKPATFHDNVKLEMIWTVVPFVILVAMAIPSTATLIEMSDTSKSEMTVKITGFQWKWRYDYLDHDLGYFSSLATQREQIENAAPKGEHYLLEVDHPLVLPVGKKIRFLMTANDVIHSWWVPAFGVKTDSIPGFINESWATINEPGTYRGVCAELCGKDHGFMPIVVNAVTPEEFDKWVVAQKQKASAEAASGTKTWTKEELMAKGKEVYNQCAACHQPDGKGMKGVFPALAGSKVATGPVAEHIKTVLQGRKSGKFPAPMPPLGAQLNDADIAAVITYERNSFGNQTGDIVQPAQVKAAR